MAGVDGGMREMNRTMTPRGTYRPGFTLAELMAASAIMGIVVLALASAMLIASQALPDEDRTATRILRSGDVLQQIADELAEALAITEHGANSVAFIVADRDADGAPERIRYAWANTNGAPLTRSVNGATAVTLVSDVHAFALAYTLRPAVETYPGVPVESAEQLLCSRTTATQVNNFAVKEQEWVAMLLEPSLPADALGWRVTRAKLQARVKGANFGVAAVQIRIAQASGLPGTTVLGQQLMPESNLSSEYTWQEFSFTDLARVNPADKLCLAVVSEVKDADICEVFHADKVTGGMSATANGEGDWKDNAEKELFYAAYGTYFSPGADQAAVRRYVTAVDLHLQAGADTGAQLRTATRLMNEPELLRAFWEWENGQVVAVDRNGDGAADFELAGDWLVDPLALPPDGTGRLDSLVIAASGQFTLRTSPTNDFSDLTTIVVKYRDKVADTQAAFFTIYADWSGISATPINAALMLNADNTQTLVVTLLGTSGAVEEVLNVEGLPDAPVELRLLIDPLLDTVNVRVEDVDQGTYRYAVTSAVSDARFAQFTPWGVAGVEFTALSVRVAERAP